MALTFGGESHRAGCESRARGAESLADLMDRAKQGSAPMNVGSPGLGTLGQYIVEQLRRAGSMKDLNHIPYCGGAPLATDLLGNHVSVGCLPIAARSDQHIANGTRFLLVVSAMERVPVLKGMRPHSASWLQQGHRRSVSFGFGFLLGPKDCRAAMVDSLSAAGAQDRESPVMRQESSVKRCCRWMRAPTESVTGGARPLAAN